MNKIGIIILIFFFTKEYKSQTPNYQVALPVDVISQERNQWCWAGTSKSLLDYYGVDRSQTEIAEYARLNNPGMFGKIPCGQPNDRCNQPNTMFGSYNGDIQGIVRYFSNTDSHGVNAPLNTSQINNELKARKPFFIRIGWNSGGGHFRLGYGLSQYSTPIIRYYWNGSYYYPYIWGYNYSYIVNYMDPWPGEGKKIENYNSLVSNSSGRWTHSLILDAPPNTWTNKSISDENNQSIDNKSLQIYPNPAKDYINLVPYDHKIEQAYIFSFVERNVKQVNIDRNNKIDVSALIPGNYILKVIQQDGSIAFKTFIKL
ncbi:T9SS type A sorting domain-containing protein [Chryseobacterium fistulae]|uniref:Secretion system C-terminal sorting domain-containing protein n=1 Tax=Chryseobacterium fistulae TaxID=2675058 RepID=A0A6N4XR66_9FLAO|nr:T9SS type A sorting domain-containing protein [Chryseobacterium fistulae]CAA7385900.1 hypothetical protein CHRY9393_00188 [Chryseobacterium fistulae]